MRKIWNGYMKEAVFLFSIIYTFVTIANSILYLIEGLYEDPNGNWHELDRAIIVLIGVFAFELLQHIPTKNGIMKSIIVYIPTLLLTFIYVWLSGLREPLANNAYRDIFINFTGMFILISLFKFGNEKIKEIRGIHNTV